MRMGMQKYRCRHSDARDQTSQNHQTTCLTKEKKKDPHADHTINDAHGSRSEKRNTNKSKSKPSLLPKCPDGSSKCLSQKGNARGLHQICAMPQTHCANVRGCNTNCSASLRDR